MSLSYNYYGTMLNDWMKKNHQTQSIVISWSIGVERKRCKIILWHFIISINIAAINLCRTSKKVQLRSENQRINLLSLTFLLFMLFYSHLSPSPSLSLYILFQMDMIVLTIYI